MKEKLKRFWDQHKHAIKTKLFIVYFILGIMGYIIGGFIKKNKHKFKRRA